MLNTWIANNSTMFQSVWVGVFFVFFYLFIYYCPCWQRLTRRLPSTASSNTSRLRPCCLVLPWQPLVRPIRKKVESSFIMSFMTKDQYFKSAEHLSLHLNIPINASHRMTSPTLCRLYKTLQGRCIRIFMPMYLHINLLRPIHRLLLSYCFLSSSVCPSVTIMRCVSAL